MTIANGERSKLRRFLMDGTMERYRNGTVSVRNERNGKGPVTERDRRDLKNTAPIPVKRTSIGAVKTGIGTILYRSSIGHCTGKVPVLFVKERYTTGTITVQYWPFS